MKVTLSTGQTLSVQFVHSTHGAHAADYEAPEGRGITRSTVDNFAKELGRRLTLCEIAEVRYSGDSTAQSDETDYVLLGQGWSVCHPNDAFKKESGRKIAFAKSLEAVGFDRITREELWDAYLAEFAPEIAAAKVQAVRGEYHAFAAGHSRGRIA